MKNIAKSLRTEINAFFKNRIVIYILRRILTMVPMFFGMSMTIFAIMRFLGSPSENLPLWVKQRDKVIETLQTKYGTGNKNYFIQYYLWLKSFFSWDFGYSITLGTDRVAPLMNDLIKYTLRMQLISIVLAVAISLLLGTFAARHHLTKVDTTISVIAYFGNSIPVFVLGIFLLLLTTNLTFLGWLPNQKAYTAYQERASFWEFIFRPNQISNGNTSINKITFWNMFIDNLLHLILPVITLTLVSLAAITRMLRSNLLEILRQDYILSARANGLSERTIIWKHALRNAVIPVITIVGINLGLSIAGSPIIETVFAWPGLGKAYIDAINDLDMVLVISVAMILTICIMITNLIADILYVFTDPRVKL